MNRMIFWVKTHKLTSLLLLVVVWYMFGSFSRNLINFSSRNRSVSSDFSGTFESGSPINAMQKLAPPGIQNRGSFDEIAPVSNIADRMVIKNSQMSLKVQDVSDSLKQILLYTDSIGGYMVESSISNPQDAANGTITLRIPETSFDESLEYFRTLSVKVVSENLSGRDVSDQYQDINERLRILEGNKKRFEEIMQGSTEISDIVNVQERIFSIQNQIDSLKGQQQLLSQTAKLSKVTLYLSTDELSLPYAPEQSWRPQVVFQSAVRSLLTKLQDIGSLVIWLVVYSVVWLPVLGGILYFKNRRKKNQVNS